MKLRKCNKRQEIAFILNMASDYINHGVVEIQSTVWISLSNKTHWTGSDTFIPGDKKIIVHCLLDVMTERLETFHSQSSVGPVVHQK